jgi:hypothetical protein
MIQTELWLPQPRREVFRFFAEAQPASPHAALVEVRGADTRAHRNAAGSAQ